MISSTGAAYYFEGQYLFYSVDYLTGIHAEEIAELLRDNSIGALGVVLVSDVLVSYLTHFHGVDKAMSLALQDEFSIRVWIRAFGADTLWLDFTRS